MKANRIFAHSWQFKKTEPTHEPITLLTEADGRARITTDWIRIFGEASERFDQVHLQTRHAYGRLVTQINPSSLGISPDGVLARAFDRRLTLRRDTPFAAHARVQHCDCCGCPGRIECRNRNGLEFLQLCPPSALSPATWARYAVVLSGEAPQSRADRPELPFPTVPANAQRLPINPVALAWFLEEIRARGAGVEVTLLTAETSNRRSVYPEAIEYDGRILGAYSDTSSFQLGIAGIRSLRLGTGAENEAPALFVAGADNAQLLAIEPSSEPNCRDVFAALLEQLASETS